MPAGLQIFDASGNLIADHTTSYGRYIGMFNTKDYPGNSFTDSRLADGRPWFVKMFDHNDLTATTSCPVNITVSGTTISWTIKNPGSRKDCFIFWGLY